MQIKALYSHLNGQDTSSCIASSFGTEIQQVIEQVDAEACKTKVSRKRPCRAGFCTPLRT